jgi:hypothetical protein
MVTASVPAERLRETLTAWLSEHDMLRGITWYSRGEWAARGETMCTGAALHVVMEESRLRGLLNFEWAGWGGCEPVSERLYEEFCNLLDGHGYCHEVGFAWSAHFYQEVTG